VKIEIKREVSCPAPEDLSERDRQICRLCSHSMFQVIKTTPGNKESFEREIDQIKIVATPAQDARHADRRVAEIAALFAFLEEWHDILTKYSFELPTPDLFLRAA